MPSGVFYDPLNLAIETLGAVTEMLAWTGEATPAAVKARCYRHHLPPPAGGADAYSLAELQNYRPFVLASFPTQGGWSCRRDATESFAATGIVRLMFEQDVPIADVNNPQKIDDDVTTSMGRIVTLPGSSGILELAHVAGYLAVDRLDAFGPFRGDPVEQPGEGDFVYWYFELGWGNQS